MSTVPRAVIFDLDGTIIDSHAYTFAAFRHACLPWRTTLTDSEVFAAFGPSERVILRRLVPEKASAAYDRLQEFYRGHVADVAVHAAMRPLLHDLRHVGARLGLFTGRGADSTQFLLDALDLAWAFDAIVAGDSVLEPKPAPDGILSLRATLGSSATSTLVVGDSPLDVQSAQAAGSLALFATWHAWSGVVPPPDIPLLRHPDALRPFVGLPGAAI